MTEQPYAVFDSDGHVDKDQDEIAACFALARCAVEKLSGSSDPRVISLNLTIGIGQADGEEIIGNLLAQFRWRLAFTRLAQQPICQRAARYLRVIAFGQRLIAEKFFEQVRVKRDASRRIASGWQRVLVAPCAVLDGTAGDLQMPMMRRALERSEGAKADGTRRPAIKLSLGK